ncbi:MAG: sigma 54-interacting transcriptional regulator [Bdellovibrionota bacterium]
MRNLPRNVGELKASGYKRRSVKDEIRENLVAKLKQKDEIFPGIVGYDDSVIPQIVNAVLARQNFILLGLRGQAKTRILRQLATLLDPELPVLAGSEINDDPLEPVSAFGKQLIKDMGDSAPVSWVARDNRYVEKLATPDTTISDLIGDVDPIKAAHGGHLLSDELTIHFGLLPRANRGIFCINEVPDLASKVQVGLFNIMQEGDIQIKGYPVRLPLDILLVFSANPEDYTARGKIITPLKDRIGAEIRTHYPRTIEEGVSISMAEAWTDRQNTHSLPVTVPTVIWQIVEHLAFFARGDRRIDQRSGVSQRLPISVIESVVSNAERRALITGESRIVPRISDIYAAGPSITGKIELEYEGEQIGADRITSELIRKSCGAVFERCFSGVNTDPVVEAFGSGRSLSIAELSSDSEVLQELEKIPGLLDTADRGSFSDVDNGLPQLKCELLLQGLYAQKRIARKEDSGGATAWARAKSEKARNRNFETSDDTLN